MNDGGPAVAVVGGGIAGLAAAWELCSSAGTATRVVVLEAGVALGGKIGSGEIGGRRVDLGPDAFVARRPEAVELCAEVGLASELVHPATSTAYVWSRGRLRPLPAGLALGVPTRLLPLARSGVLSAAGLARAALDLCRPPVAVRTRRRVHGNGAGLTTAAASDAPIGELVGRRLGREVVERLADPLIGGIHAGDVRSMSAAAVFPPLLEAQRRPGSFMRALRGATPPTAASTSGPEASSAPAPVFSSVRGGLSVLVDRMAAALGERGADVRTGSAVEALGRGERWMIETAEGPPIEADAVVLAVPAPAAAGLVHPHASALAEQLRSIRYAGVVLVTMRFARADVGGILPGSGFLVPRTGGGMVTACTWMSSKWPALARPGDVLVRASLGRDGDDRPLHLDDDAVVQRVVEELTPAMGLRGRPDETVVARFPASFPQYDVGHVAKVAAIERAAASVGGLSLAGAYLQGVGIPACIASGRRAARAARPHVEEAARP